MMKDFLIGALGYPALELAYRRRTHYSMALAGGICHVLIRRIARRRGSRAGKALLGAAAVTGCELLIGLVFNRHHKVWDYRSQHFHIAGQVCPRYFAIWYALCYALMR